MGRRFQPSPRGRQAELIIHPSEARWPFSPKRVRNVNGGSERLQSPAAAAHHIPSNSPAGFCPGSGRPDRARNVSNGPFLKDRAWPEGGATGTQVFHHAELVVLLSGWVKGSGTERLRGGAAGTAGTAGTTGIAGTTGTAHLQGLKVSWSQLGGVVVPPAAAPSQNCNQLLPRSQKQHLFSSAGPRGRSHAPSPCTAMHRGSIRLHQGFSGNEMKSDTPL